MKYFNNFLNSSKSLNELRSFILYRKWSKSQYVMPAPHHIKQSLILRNMVKGAIFIETGTHIGSTAKLASKYSKIVYTLEPSYRIFKIAIKNLNNLKNIKLINGTSEENFPELLSSLDGDVTFWLDGHYSGDETYKGKTDSPIIKELEIIESNINNFSNLVIMIDDIRLFKKSNLMNSGYPSKMYLVNWAEENNLEWEFEQDIFIAKKSQ